MRKYGAYGSRLSNAFRMHNAPSLITRILRKSTIGITELRCDQPNFGRTAPLPREDAGVSPHRWLLQHRVERAKELMRTRALSHADVAMFCGFADQSHFTRVFTAMAELSPGAWRRIHAVGLNKLG